MEKGIADEGQERREEIHQFRTALLLDQKITTSHTFLTQLIPEVHRKTAVRRRFQGYIRIDRIRLHGAQPTETLQLHEQAQDIFQPQTNENLICEFICSIICWAVRPLIRKLAEIRCFCRSLF